MKCVVSVFILMLSLGVSAECNQNSCESPVKRIYSSSHPDGFVYIEMDDDTSALNCTMPEGRFVTLKKTHPLFDQIFSMLLAANFAKAPIRLRMIDNSSDCEVAYSWIYNP